MVLEALNILGTHLHCRELLREVLSVGAVRQLRLIGRYHPLILNIVPVNRIEPGMVGNCANAALGATQSFCGVLF